MLNIAIQIKVKQRLNKLASGDYDNLPNWQIVEAFNKGQVLWCRRQFRGGNQYREGDEQSSTRIDDLQILLKDTPTLVLSDKITWVQAPLPDDYMRFKRISAFADKDCCKSKRLVVYEAEEANVDVLLADANKQPDFEWGHTFATLEGNQVKIYTDNKFTVSKSFLTYYRQPRAIEMAGSSNPYTGVTSAVDVLCEFKDDITELLIEEAAGILAGDILDPVQTPRLPNNVEKNN